MREPTEAHRHIPPLRLLDNIDKYVKPRDMTIDAQASTLHYFNMYAVCDRLDASQLPDNPTLPDVSTIKVEQILPTDHSNFAILVCCVLKKHMPFFTKFGLGIERHNRHIYSEEMSRKSEVVSIYCTHFCWHALSCCITILSSIYTYNCLHSGTIRNRTKK